MKVLLVDDHPLFLEGLQNLLASRDVDVVGAAQDGFEALEQARALRPDVVLMDVQMPRCDGLTATRLIKAEMPDVRIVMLTVSDEDEDLFEAIRCGACGYLLKSLDADDFFTRLAGLARGEPALSPGLTGRLLAAFAGRENSAALPSDDGLAGLSPRQVEVLTLVAQGLTYREVGEVLCIAERTVKYHMKEILSRLHLKNQAQAIAYAARAGLVRGKPPDPDA